ncbi:MAG: hypothetical protein ACREF4_00335 [Gammaproteobacteria bacterium]
MTEDRFTVEREHHPPELRVTCVLDPVTSEEAVGPSGAVCPFVGAPRPRNAILNDNGGRAAPSAEVRGRLARPNWSPGA